MTEIAKMSDFIKKMLHDMSVLSGQIMDMDERLTFYEERITTNRLMIYDNRFDIDRLEDARADRL